MDSKTVAKVRKVFLGNNALLVCLPVDFVRKTGLSKGDEVVVIYDNSMLTVMPSPSKLKELKEAKNGVYRPGANL